MKIYQSSDFALKTIKEQWEIIRPDIISLFGKNVTFSGYLYNPFFCNDVYILTPTGRTKKKYVEYMHHATINVENDLIYCFDKNFEKGLVALQCLVKSWNFTDDDEKELPITKESLSQLSSKDFNFLLTKVSEVVTNVEVKKNVSSKT